MNEKIITLLQEGKYDEAKHALHHEQVSLHDAKAIVDEIKKHKEFSPGAIELKIAVLSSYTIRPIRDMLEFELLKNGFQAEIKYGEYNQYMQELLDPTSFVYGFKPDIVILALDTETFLEKSQFTYLDMTEGAMQELLRQKREYLLTAIRHVGSQLSAKIILTNLEVPTYAPEGIRDATRQDGYRYLIAEFNHALAKECCREKNVVILDFEKLAGHVGKKQLTDKKYFYLGKCYLGKEIIPLFCQEIIHILNASYGRTKKCLILDLDNTLWGGVVGEEGPLGITLGGDGVGAIYQEVQKIVRNLYKRGVVLAIASKNNIEDVLPVFEQNKNMIVQKEWFASMKINWKEKTDNILEIAQELNLGLDSFVFLDDNPVERGAVKQRLPMVLVPDFPEDISELPELLMHLHCFSLLDVTEEDKRRNEMYAQEKKRAEVQKTFANVTEYLYDLQTRIEVKKDSEEDIERITQLINKTNQFNLCTHRYSKEEVIEKIRAPNQHVFSAKVWDKFGELGLTVICIIYEKEDALEIIDFLMSCRVMNRGIEKEFLRTIVAMLPKKKCVVGKYVPTKKNEPVKEFYEKVGFVKEKEENGSKEYSYDYTQPLEAAAWIRVNYA